MAQTLLLSDSEEDQFHPGEMGRKRNRNHDDENPEIWRKKNRKPTLTLREQFSRFPWKSFFVVSCLPFALAPIVVLASAAQMTSMQYLYLKDCYPNGLWSEGSDATWEIMDSSYFFTPNLSFGNMAFTEVKMIDITWDLVVGRGGQLLLAWVNYKVFNEWIVYHMELHATSYKMFTSIAFETTSLNTLGVLGKEFLAFGQSNWRRFFRWLAVLSMFLSTLYVLSFPTLMAAMTGYLATYEAYLEDFNHDLIAVNKFEPVAYIVHDYGTRVAKNGSGPLIVTFSDKELKASVTDYLINTFNLVRTQHNDMTSNSSMSYKGNLEEFTIQENRESEWTFEDRIRLPAPTLNITMLHNVSAPGDANSRRIKHPFYTPGGRSGALYNSSYILSNGSCKPRDRYQWGFSYIFLFMVSIFHFIWTCVMVGMWLDTVRASRMYKSGRRPGLIRSVLDLSVVVREEIGKRADKLQEDDLRRALGESQARLVVPEGELKIARTVIGDERVRMRSWKNVKQQIRALLGRDKGPANA